jgi:hypothetical protein
VRMYTTRGVAQLSVVGTNMGRPEDQHAKAKMAGFDMGTIALLKETKFSSLP